MEVFFGILGGAVVLLVAIGAVVVFQAKQREAEIRQTGKPVLACLVMANELFWTEGEYANAPALVAIRFGPPSLESFGELAEVAARVGELYHSSLGGLGPEERRVAEMAQDDEFVTDRRRKLPTGFTGGLEIYLADLWLRRDYMPPNATGNQPIPCMATGTGLGKIMQLPHDDPVARRLTGAF